MKRNRFITALSLIAALFFSHQIASAQLLQKYLAQDQIDRATETAKDSIGADAILVGIAAPGEVDLNDIGFPITADGFSKEDGTSSVWGYLFMTPSRDDSIGVAVARFAIGDPLVLAEREGDFDQEAIALDLSGANSGSDAFATILRANPTFIKYHQDYNDAIPEAAVLAWRPSGVELLAASFPSRQASLGYLLWRRGINRFLDGLFCLFW